MADEDADGNVPEKLSFGWLFSGAGLVLALWAISWWYIPKMFKLENSAGEFGDMFGAVNALFSGLAFAGLIYTIYLQRRELALQRNELIFTRKELEGQKNALESQNSTLHKQNFENTFFQLLTIQNQIVNAIDLGRGDSATRGRDCFKIFFTRFGRAYGRLAAETGLERLRDAYSEFYADNQANVGHYFRNLYTLIKFVDRSDMKDKRIYTNIVRAQLSSYEQMMLFYNCLSPLGEGFKEFVEQYALLKQVPTSELLDQQHRDFYEDVAFG